MRRDTMDGLVSPKAGPEDPCSRLELSVHMGRNAGTHSTIRQGSKLTWERKTGGAVRDAWLEIERHH